jgi:BASS family bile acid:Na+ symporter
MDAIRGLALVPRALTPLALLAAALALIAPSAGFANDSDLLLAGLVVVTALGISAGDLARLRAHAVAVTVLSIVPFVVLTALGWALGRIFDPGPVRDGLLACGLSSSEVASVGLVALAGADATIALGAVTGSLVVAALLGPVVIGWLGGAGAHADGGALLGRFALVVVLPLVVGVAVRSAVSRLERVDAERDGLAALIVVALVYSSLSGEHGAHDLGTAVGAGAAFLAGSALVALLWRRRAASPAAIPGAFAIAMRDFAVAAALATQAFGPAAGVVPGVYGVLMLVGGSVAVTALRAASASASAAGREV